MVAPYFVIMIIYSIGRGPLLYIPTNQITGLVEIDQSEGFNLLGRAPQVVSALIIIEAWKVSQSISS